MPEFCVKNTFYDEISQPDLSNLRRIQSAPALLIALETYQEQENQQNLAKFITLVQELENSRRSFEQFLADTLKEDPNFNLCKYNFLVASKAFLKQDHYNRDMVIHQTLKAYQSLQSVIEFQEKLQGDPSFQKALLELNKKHSSHSSYDHEQYIMELKKFLAENGILEFNNAHIQIAIAQSEMTLCKSEQLPSNEPELSYHSYHTAVETRTSQQPTSLR